MVRRSVTNPGTWEIAWVLDWDDIIFLPPVLARKPPVWLWWFYEQDVDFTNWNSDVNFRPYKRYDAKDCVLAPEQQEVKIRVETCLIEDLAKIHPGYTIDFYRDEAHGRGHWLGKLGK